MQWAINTQDVAHGQHRDEVTLWTASFRKPIYQEFRFFYMCWFLQTCISSVPLRRWEQTTEYNYCLVNHRQLLKAGSYQCPTPHATFLFLFKARQFQCPTCHATFFNLLKLGHCNILQDIQHFLYVKSWFIWCSTGHATFFFTSETWTKIPKQSLKYTI